MYVCDGSCKSVDYDGVEEFLKGLRFNLRICFLSIKV